MNDKEYLTLAEASKRADEIHKDLEERRRKARQAEADYNKIPCDDSDELETLRTLFDLCVRTFDYPREVEMIGGGLSQAERAMLYEAFEARFKFLFGDTDDDDE